MTRRIDIPAAEVVALRYVLAMARGDRIAAEEAVDDMSEFEPGVIVGVLAGAVLDFARPLAEERDMDAVEVIEQ
jgi:hypothetical protein